MKIIWILIEFMQIWNTGSFSLKHAYPRDVYVHDFLRRSKPELE